jgi:patatin-like phospholipase/acyl hydrolase
MNSYIGIVATQCSLGTWFCLRNMSVHIDTLHKGDIEEEDNDDDNNNNNNNNNTRKF